MQLATCKRNQKEVRKKVQKKENRKTGKLGSWKLEVAPCLSGNTNTKHSQRAPNQLTHHFFLDIAISQITWLYVLVLPFQLFSKLGWVAVPGTVVAGMSQFISFVTIHSVTDFVAVVTRHSLHPTPKFCNTNCVGKRLTNASQSPHIATSCADEDARSVLRFMTELVLQSHTQSYGFVTWALITFSRIPPHTTPNNNPL